MYIKLTRPWLNLVLLLLIFSNSDQVSSRVCFEHVYKKLGVIDTIYSYVFDRSSNLLCYKPTTNEADFCGGEKVPSPKRDPVNMFTRNLEGGLVAPNVCSLIKCIDPIHLSLSSEPFMQFLKLNLHIKNTSTEAV